MAKAPKPGMSSEELYGLQAERAKEFGIEALPAPPARLNFPKGFPRKFADWGDPVNLAFPLAPVGRLKAARGRFKQYADRYKQEASKRVVHTRIVQRMLRDGLKVSFNAKDPLDQLLSPALKRRLTKKSFDGEIVFELKALSDDDAKARGYEAQPGEIVVEAYAAAGNLDLTQFGKGPADRIERGALEDIADWLVARYKTVLFNHLDDKPIGRVIDAEVVTDDADGVAKIRVIHTISGTEPGFVGKVKDGTLSKMSIRFIPLEVKLETDAKTKKQIRVITRAVGLECSIVSIPMNWSAEVIAWEARSFSEGRAEGRQAVEISAPVEWRSADEFVAAFSWHGLREMAEPLQKRLSNAPVSREDADSGAGIFKAYLHDGVLVVEGRLGAAGECAPELRSLVLYGQKAADDDAAPVIEAAELSAAEAIGVRTYAYPEEPSMSDALIAACERAAELYRSLSTEEDAEKLDELKAELSEAFDEAEKAAPGVSLVRVFAKSAGADEYMARIAEAKSAMDCHMAALWHTIHCLDALAAESMLPDAVKSALMPLVGPLRVAAGGPAQPTVSAGGGECEMEGGEKSAEVEAVVKSITAEDVEATVKSVTKALKAEHDAELKSLREALEAAGAEKSAAIEAVKAEAKAALDTALGEASKAASERADALQKALEAVAARVGCIEKQVGAPNGSRDGERVPTATTTHKGASTALNADIEGDYVSTMRKHLNGAALA